MPYISGNMQAITIRMNNLWELGMNADASFGIRMGLKGSFRMKYGEEMEILTPRWGWKFIDIKCRIQDEAGECFLMMREFVLEEFDGSGQWKFCSCWDMLSIMQGVDLRVVDFAIDYLWRLQGEFSSLKVASGYSDWAKHKDKVIQNSAVSCNVLEQSILIGHLQNHQNLAW
jgi:hypothetical protein